MFCKSFLTLNEALTALDEMPCNEDKNIDHVNAPPNVAVISNEEAMDDEDLVQDFLGLPNAASEIEIHQNTIGPKAISFSVSSPATKKS